MTNPIEEIKHFINVTENATVQDKANFYFMTKGMIHMANVNNLIPYLTLKELENKLISVRGW